jgi:hypothetical protein
MSFCYRIAAPVRLIVVQRIARTVDITLIGFNFIYTVLMGRVFLCVVASDVPLFESNSNIFLHGVIRCFHWQPRLVHLFHVSGIDNPCFELRPPMVE